MTKYDYLIVGGGMTAAAAADGIREVDADGSIGMFSSELDAPYNRPPLSKALWKGKSLDSIWRKMKNVDLHLGSVITEIVPHQKRAMEVVMIFPGNAIGERIFPTDLAQFVSDYYLQKGIALLSNERVVASDAHGNQRVLKTAGGREVVVDGVVAGIGIEPNVALAESAGLKTDNGIMVDAFLRSSKADIYAAGDVASFLSLGSHRRVEHEDNANSMGRLAGRNMAGMAERYDYLPSFYSDMFDLGYEAVGKLDSRFETFADWKRPNEEGVVYYLKDGRVRGVLLWNVWGKVDAARELIAQPGPVTPQSLKGRIA